MIALNQGTEKIRFVISFLLTVFIFMSISIFIYFLYFINEDITIKIVGTIIVTLIAAIWLLFEYRSRNRPKYVDYESNIKKLILITRDGEREKEWHCEGITSFLIGKGTTSTEVDIELGDTHYTEYISNEHAVLNKKDGYWYIEDLESLNGVGLKKKGDEYALRLKPLTPYKVDEGDILYISKAKLLIR